MSDLPYDIITFDCYGTLIDWEAGIGEAFEIEARRLGLTPDRSEILRVYHEVEPLIQGREYYTYRRVLTETARRTADRLGWALPDDRNAFLVESLPTWKPFPDTNPALERFVRAGFRLGILSNTDDDLLRLTRKHFTVDFDVVITAQEVRSYKPAPSHFLQARSKIGCDWKTRWLHAAQSYFHDVQPSRALGHTVAWVNRLHEPAPVVSPTTLEVYDLTGLADAVIPRRSVDVRVNGGE